jgi:glycosyltransferase involved in cell wall biosynthesis
LTDKPGVSICIPCFNSSARRPETLRALQKERVASSLACEVTLIDTASTDSSRRILLWYATWNPRVRVFEEPLRRMPRSFIRGLEVARGKYIFPFDEERSL